MNAAERRRKIDAFGWKDRRGPNRAVVQGVEREPERAGKQRARCINKPFQAVTSNRPLRRKSSPEKVSDQIANFQPLDLPL